MLTTTSLNSTLFNQNDEPNLIYNPVDLIGNGYLDVGLAGSGVPYWVYGSDLTFGAEAPDGTNTAWSFSNFDYINVFDFDSHKGFTWNLPYNLNPSDYSSLTTSIWLKASSPGITMQLGRNDTYVTSSLEIDIQWKHYRITCPYIRSYEDRRCMEVRIPRGPEGTIYLWGPKIAVKPSCFFPKPLNMPEVRYFPVFTGQYLSEGNILIMPLSGQVSYTPIVAPDPILIQALVAEFGFNGIINPLPILSMALNLNLISSLIVVPNVIQTEQSANAYASTDLSPVAIYVNIFNSYRVSSYTRQDLFIITPINTTYNKYILTSYKSSDLYAIKGLNTSYILYTLSTYKSSDVYLILPNTITYNKYNVSAYKSTDAYLIIENI